MKNLYSNTVTLFFLIVTLVLYFLPHSNDLGYWRFLTHDLVLNMGVVVFALAAGFLVKNYLLLILGVTFALLVFSATLMFSPGIDLMIQFFFAIFTVFLAFSVIANLCRHFRDWLLAEKMYA
jgi:hypothetical protein